MRCHDTFANEPSISRGIGLRIGQALGLHLCLDGQVDHAPFVAAGGVQVAAALGGVGVGRAQVVGAHGCVVQGAVKQRVGLGGCGAHAAAPATAAWTARVRYGCFAATAWPRLRPR